MFLLRGVAVSFSVFFLLYALLSFAIAKGWKVAAVFYRQRSQEQLADALFLARMLPLAVAFLTTVVFVVPSFLLLEPRWSQERLRVLPILLGWAGLVLVAFGVWNAIKALAKTAHVVQAWRLGAEEIVCPTQIPVFCTTPANSGRGPGQASPPFAVAGIVRPAVFMSPAAAAVLSGPELQSVIRHEMAHVHRRDNLKRLLFRACAFPFMQRIEHAWADATEAAADDAAVSSTGEALDLAAALVKLSRLVAEGSAHTASTGRPADAELTMALLHAGTTVPDRVERLVAWTQPSPAPARIRRTRYASALIGAGIFALSYGPLLLGAHAVTELLMQ